MNLSDYFFQGDLIMVKQSAVLFGIGSRASMFIPDEPQLAVFLGREPEPNTLKVLIGSNKWLVKAKDCSHYDKYKISRRKNEQNSDQTG